MVEQGERVDRDPRQRGADPGLVDHCALLVVGAVRACPGGQPPVQGIKFLKVFGDDVGFHPRRALCDRVAQGLQLCVAQRAASHGVQTRSDAQGPELGQHRRVGFGRRKTLQLLAQGVEEDRRVLADPGAGDMGLVHLGVGLPWRRRCVRIWVLRVPLLQRDDSVGVLDLAHVLQVGLSMDQGAPDHPDPVLRRVDPLQPLRRAALPAPRGDEIVAVAIAVRGGADVGEVPLPGFQQLEHVKAPGASGRVDDDRPPAEVEPGHRVEGVAVGRHDRPVLGVGELGEVAELVDRPGTAAVWHVDARARAEGAGHVENRHAVVIALLRHLQRRVVLRLLGRVTRVEGG